MRLAVLQANSQRGSMRAPVHLLVDFDGTISLSDTTDLLLQHFADPAWVGIEGRGSEARLARANAWSAKSICCASPPRRWTHSFRTWNSILTSPPSSSFATRLAYPS